MTTDTVSRSAAAGRKRQRTKKLSVKFRAAIIERDGLYCRYCGLGPLRVSWGYDPKYRMQLYQGCLNLDHLVPLRWGGSDDPENLVVACTPCNNCKGTGEAPALRDPAPMCFLPPTPTPLGRKDTTFAYPGLSRAERDAELVRTGRTEV